MCVCIHVHIMYYFLESEVKVKLKSLRTREKQKAKKRKTGSGTDDVYKSKWPYFEQLPLLDEFVVARIEIVYQICRSVMSM